VCLQRSLQHSACSTHDNRSKHCFTSSDSARFTQKEFGGTGLPWWCTSFQAPPCFSKTLVAAILRGEQGGEETGHISDRGKRLFGLEKEQHGRPAWEEWQQQLGRYLVAVVHAACNHLAWPFGLPPITSPQRAVSPCRMHDVLLSNAWRTCRGSLPTL
jgi:hypothetical protein